MALSIHSQANLPVINANLGCYFSLAATLGASPKAAVLIVTGVGNSGAADNPERTFTHAFIGGRPGTLRKENFDDVGATDLGAAQVWTWDSDQLVGLHPTTALCEVWREDDNSGGTGIRARLYVLNAGTWAGHHISGGVDGDQTNPTVSLAVSASVARLFSGLFSGHNATGSVGAGVGYTKDMSVNFAGNLQSGHAESANADVGAGSHAADWVAALEDAALVATAIAEVPNGTPRVLDFEFVGMASAAGATPALASLTDQNGNPVAHQAGDLAIAIAANIEPSASPTIPSLPTGGSSDFSNVNQGQVVGAGDDIGWRIGTRNLQGTETDYGTWTNADEVLVLIYRGPFVDPDVPVGAFATAQGTALRITFPSLSGSMSVNPSIVVLLGVKAAGTVAPDVVRDLAFPFSRPAINGFQQFITRSRSSLAPRLFGADSVDFVTDFAGGDTTTGDLGSVLYLGAAVELVMEASDGDGDGLPVHLMGAACTPCACH